VLQASIDGEALREIALRSEAPRYGARIALASGLSNGPHYVELTTGGEPGTQVDIDGLVVRRTYGAWLRNAAIVSAALAAAAAMSVLYRRRNH